MPDGRRRLILGNGEQYIQPITKRFTGRAAEPPRAYADARDLVKRGVAAALTAFETLPEEKRQALYDDMVALAQRFDRNRGAGPIAIVADYLETVSERA